DCLGVGHYYEIDATIADIYLVSSEDVNKIIGKPTLYLIIDRKSRLIVGFYFGLENASWNGAMQAILCISENKRGLCARYGVRSDCLGVGHYYEIDATIADIYLVSSEDVNKIIGKPTLYLIIDRKSRLIVGFYFGLENASWNGAMQAILCISENKRGLCARYGV